MADAAHAELYAESRRAGNFMKRFTIRAHPASRIFSGALRWTLQINSILIDYPSAFLKSGKRFFPIAR
ncbi:hypothetical protein LFL97_04890 [Burkholderia sp. JSH-S8]|uniref:hypothetical protein n=1 Tax=Burkholderia stagnalis TaxID=1503054 RepID=UPI000F80E1D9|nr:hypothetical protein [Burkholderia stagnalis]WGS42874.1 hypothetical protein LFL97_04890 [Burkholderia sp. JSH-S8]